MDTRPMRADARRNYERLITTARIAFMENGTGASLDDIAKRAGVGSGTLYRHFPTRDALLHAVLRERIDGLLAHADELLAEPDPDAALGLWLRTYLSGAATPRGTSTVIIEAMSAEWADTGLGAAPDR
jgi:AcrR family transcriptional regulator